MNAETIDSILVDAIEGSGEMFHVGRCGVTRIEAYDENGLHCGIPYIRVWKGDEKLAEFCKHNIVGVYFATEKESA